MRTHVVSRDSAVVKVRSAPTLPLPLNFPGVTCGRVIAAWLALWSKERMQIAISFRSLTALEIMSFRVGELVPIYIQVP